MELIGYPLCTYSFRVKHKRALLSLTTADVVSVPVRRPGGQRHVGPAAKRAPAATQLPLFQPDPARAPMPVPAVMPAVMPVSRPVPPGHPPLQPAGPAALSVPSLPAGESLHPALWRAHQMARAGTAVLPSGFDVLDLQLPGGGWPTGVLTELLLPQPGVGELRLLAPLLVALQRAQRSVVWFDPPALPCAAGLAQLGLDMRRLVVVQGPSQPAADTLWALEQALKSGQLGAVLAWLPARLPAEVLRRLQLAAQAHEGVAVLLRHSSLAVRPSPAPLRLALACAGPDRLRVTVLKRRGPPALQPLLLRLVPVLSPTAVARVQRQAASAARGTAALEASA